MPATEQTWRDIKRMHWIFMVSGLALLGATLWMFSADHNREWKTYQDRARDIDQNYNQWMQLQFKTNDEYRQHEQLSLALDQARSQPLNEQKLDEFERELARFAQSQTDAARQNNPNAAVIEPVKISAVRSRNSKLLEDSSQRSDGITPEAVSQRQSRIHEREKALQILRDIVARAKFDEKVTLDERKRTNAGLDAAKAMVDIAVRDGDSPAETEKRQLQVDSIKQSVDRLTLDYQRLNDHRTKLDAILRDMTAAEDEARKIADAHRAALKSLESAHKQRDLAYVNWVGPIPMPGKRMLTLPIVDAFQSPRKIDNLWSDDNTIDYNFRRVRRFDRCTTCHQLMEKSLPGNADKPAYVRESTLQLQIATPDKSQLNERLTALAAETTAGESTATEPDSNAKLLAIYGFRLADAGLLSHNDVTVNLVLPQTAAAKARRIENVTKLSGNQIQDQLVQAGEDAAEAYAIKPGVAAGDVLTEINGSIIRTREQAERLLLESVSWGNPISLTIRRGVPNPYTSHPRLDLYLGSTSPHKLATFACTSCHEGQGSSTSFQWASHTPNSVLQRKEWLEDHHWSDNPHWIFPMFAQRFAESSCLKCHHNVLELEPSSRFPKAPAPKVTHGYHLVLKYGCFGCHEINGHDGPNRRVGPDMRTEPGFFAAAQQLKALPDFEKLDAQQRAWVDELIEHPERSAVRHRLYESMTVRSAESEPFSIETQKLLGVLKDVETPGIERKAGPSLRYAASKLDEKFLFDWISNPSHFRPTSRMPRFFGLLDHLADEPESKSMAESFEPIEVLGMVAYLRQRSQPFEYLSPVAGVTPAGQDVQIERGKIAFEERGCLACHSHKDFAGVEAFRDSESIVQGPDLSAIGTKFDSERNTTGRQWLYSWIRQPTRYHSRTVMPDLFLDPIERKDESGKIVEVIDPVADITAYLMSSTSDWKPAEAHLPSASERQSRAALDQLVLDNLKEHFPNYRAEKFLKSGIPDSLRGELKGAETELVVADQNGILSDEQKLQYIGRKSIGKYGCFGCHDIPTFEDAKPIGTALADWGRKDSSKLAFEHISHYLEHGHSDNHATENAAHVPSDSSMNAAAHGSSADNFADTEYFHQQIEAGNRIGFLWQKLKEPRSYDFRKTQNKRYNERLRMPKFPFSPAEREAVMTFVLGLVADPPAAKYLYQPDERETAFIEGRRVLDKFNCGGCHLLEPQKWNLAYEKGALQPPEFQGFPFMKSHFDAEVLKGSSKVDHQGLIRHSVTGMPNIVDANARPLVEDDQGDVLEADSDYDARQLTFRFDLWRPAVVSGEAYEVGVMPLAINSSYVEARQSARGGVLARYLLSPVTRREKQVNPGAKGSESWGWVPPPLVGEAEKVQSKWLHEFLLNPYPIRPAVVLRMPKFNLTSAEATALAGYFAAIDNVDYPYDFNERRQTNYLIREEIQYQDRLQAEGVTRKTSRLDDAMRIVTNGNYCVKCHLVGDYEPKGADRAKAPNLARVYERLRPDYVRKWIANPKQLLPYTSMPQNIPYPAGIDKNLYHGESIEQVDVLVDLLMNYDEYAKGHNKIAPLVQQAPPASPAPTSGGGDE